ncbi:hypothetical protein RND81_07G029700 [Saponaria officinalis]|uniref:Uncharacterized protein n=1 Tax=Saponaria officinalis TaxID=3572 RepID=A0AAW1JK37_SAPOF
MHVLYRHRVRFGGYRFGYLHYCQQASKFRNRVLACMFKTCYYEIWHQRNLARTQMELMLPRSLMRFILSKNFLRIKMVAESYACTRDVGWFHTIVSTSI